MLKMAFTWIKARTNTSDRGLSPLLMVPGWLQLIWQATKCIVAVSLRFHLAMNTLTYSMVQSSSWATNWFADSQEIPRISRNPKVHYLTHKRPPPVSILGQPNPVHIPTSRLLEIFFFFYWLYNPGWVLVCSTILFHSCLSSTFALQPTIFILYRSFSTWSIHLNLGLHTRLVLYGVHSVIFLVVLVFSILITWAAHLSLCDFINFIITSWRSILILYTHLHLGIPSGLFPFGSPPRLYTPSPHPYAPHAQAMNTLGFLIAPTHKNLNDWVNTLLDCTSKAKGL